MQRVGKGERRNSSCSVSVSVSVCLSLRALHVASLGILTAVHDSRFRRTQLKLSAWHTHTGTHTYSRTATTCVRGGFFTVIGAVVVLDKPISVGRYCVVFHPIVPSKMMWHTQQTHKHTHRVYDSECHSVRSAAKRLRQLCHTCSPVVRRVRTVARETELAETEWAEGKQSSGEGN